MCVCVCVCVSVCVCCGGNGKVVEEMEGTIFRKHLVKEEEEGKNEERERKRDR